jgi:hypothetical protein
MILPRSNSVTPYITPRNIHSHQFTQLSKRIIFTDVTLQLLPHNDSKDERITCDLSCKFTITYVPDPPVLTKSETSSLLSELIWNGNSFLSSYITA